MGIADTIAYWATLVMGVMFFLVGLFAAIWPERGSSYSKDYLTKHPNAFPFGRNVEEAALIWNRIWGIGATLMGLAIIVSFAKSALW